jgi:hypothetical protein
MQELRIEQRSESEINEELTKLLIQRSIVTEDISNIQRDNKQLVDQVNVLHRKYEKINEEKEYKAHEMRKYIESIKLKLDKTENDKIQELLKEQELLKATKHNLANEFINIQENWGNENEEMKNIYKETEINRKILKEKLTTIAQEKQLLDKEKAELERYRNRLNDEKKIIINNQLTLQLHRSFTQELPDNFSVLARRVKQVVSEAADRIVRLKSAKSEEEKDLILFQSFSPPENPLTFPSDFKPFKHHLASQISCLERRLHELRQNNQVQQAILSQRLKSEEDRVSRSVSPIGTPNGSRYLSRSEILSPVRALSPIPSALDVSENIITVSSRFRNMLYNSSKSTPKIQKHHDQDSITSTRPLGFSEDTEVDMRKDLYGRYLEGSKFIF